ncbi:MAG: TIR domain-containing protein, partial [Bacteroidota bacterium]
VKKMDKEKPKVFISYSSLDGDFAELMKVKLELSEIEVWRDVHEIAAGEEWRNEIDYGLLNADSIIVILNQNSVKSSYVTYEWAFALGNGKNIIPVLLEECEIHPRIRVLQYLDFRNQNRPWDKLADRIRQLQATSSSSTDISGGLSLEQILEGIKSLANAKSEGKRSVDPIDLTAAASKMINASNYLKSVETKLDTILWVNDNPNSNIYEREALKSLGFKFEMALNTDEATKKLEDNKYAAIISDMDRAEGPDEGYVLLKKVRQTDKNTPYIIYAGSNKIEYKVMAQEKGAQGSTNRPDELIDLVTTHIKSQPF